MGEWIAYQGKPLGKINYNNSGKRVFTATGLEALTKMLSLGPNEEVETEHGGRMSYENFQQQCLTKISAFYPTEDARLLIDMKERTLDEVQ